MLENLTANSGFLALNFKVFVEKRHTFVYSFSGKLLSILLNVMDYQVWQYLQIILEKDYEK